MLLLLQEVELGIVAGEFPKGDKEVTQREAELVVLGVKSEESLNKRGNLGTVLYSWLACYITRSEVGEENLRRKVGKSGLQQITHEHGEELLVASTWLGLIGLVNGALNP